MTTTIPANADLAVRRAAFALGLEVDLVAFMSGAYYVARLAEGGVVMRLTRGGTWRGREWVWPLAKIRESAVRRSEDSVLNSLLELLPPEDANGSD